MFQYFKIEILRRSLLQHLTTLNQNGHQFEPITKDIKVGKTQSFVIIRIQFLIQLAVGRTIHYS
jgi:hypothetical protein